MPQRPSLDYPYVPEQYRGYVDHFSEAHANNEPVILEDGTSVLFPSGWTDEDADKWRKGMDLQRAVGYSASTHDLFH